MHKLLQFVLNYNDRYKENKMEIISLYWWLVFVRTRGRATLLYLHLTNNTSSLKTTIKASFLDLLDKDDEEGNLWGPKSSWMILKYLIHKFRILVICELCYGCVYALLIYYVT